MTEQRNALQELYDGVAKIVHGTGVSDCVVYVPEWWIYEFERDFEGRCHNWTKDGRKWCTIDTQHGKAYITCDKHVISPIFRAGEAGMN